jgi:hypothetical protein
MPVARLRHAEHLTGVTATLTMASIDFQWGEQEDNSSL